MNSIIKLYFLCVCAFISITSNGQLYDQKIYLPNKVDAVLKASAYDMASWLQKATGRQFSIIEGEIQKGNGISLQWVDQAKVSSSIKEQIQVDGQSFFLEVNDNKTAKVVGSGTNSFINGIYSFLHELGFRWYMPGEAWTIVPNLKNVKLKVAKVYTPDFQNRSYFGTGGVNAIPSLDPQNTFLQDFTLWNRRNLLSTDYAVKGHMGQAFYNSNKKELDSHPEYFCNNKVNSNGRIDISNKAALSLFTNWAISQVKPNEKFPIIGVDPADGSGSKDDCLPSNMPQIRTWSDKYFWIANHVARMAEEKGINVLVQLYAYSSYSAPPQFELHKKVYPIIIPYAFQSVAEPKQYIELWQKKLDGRPMGIYDYWNITQWSSDVPQFNIYSIPEKLQLWKKSNISTIHLESTNAKGPMGHAFWLATKMMWNVNFSFEDLYNEFLNKCFGPAALDIRRMYDRWSLNYQGNMDVALSLHDLNVASSKTKDSAILQRIAELKAYVHYLKLYYDYQFKPTNQVYDELISYIYSIHHLRLLQTSALVSRYIKKPKDYVASSTQSNKSLAKEQGLKLDLRQIEKNFKLDLQQSSVPYSISNFIFDIKKASVPTKRIKPIYNPLYIIGKNNYQFYLPTSQELTFKADATAPTRILLKDSNGKLWLEKEVKGSKGYETFTIMLPLGHYSLTFGEYYRQSRLIFPEQIPFFSSNNQYDNYQYPLHYVYVPKDVSEIIYRDGLGPGINNRGNWINPEGQTVNPQLIKYDVYRVEVPTNLRGKVWVLNIGHRNFQLLNIPNVYSLNNFEYKE